MEGRVVKQDVYKRQKLASTGDTICDEKRPVVLESLDIPEPVIEVAIEPKTKTDRDARSAALNKLAKEDPSFRVKGNEETGQTLIAGMGELHLDIIVDRLVREFNVNANVGKPQVAYRETITKPSKSDLKYAKQSGGRGQYGHCVIEVEPNPEKGYEFVNAITGGVIPKEYIPSKMCIRDRPNTANFIRGYSQGVIANWQQTRTPGGVIQKQPLDVAPRYWRCV